jgi:cathepsin B
VAQAQLAEAAVLVQEAERTYAIRTADDVKVEQKVWISILFIAGILAAVISISLNRDLNNQTIDIPSEEAFGATISEPVADGPAASAVNNVMQLLTEGCTPPDDFLDSIGVTTDTGTTRNRTQTAWNLIVNYLRPTNITNPTDGCLFYGLIAAARRSGLTLGPVDFCHGFVHAVITYFDVTWGRVLPANVLDIINTGIDNAYPLTMFWRLSHGSGGGGSFPIKTTVQLQIFTMLSEYSTQNNVPINIRDVSTEFCNPWFSPDDLTYYQSGAMPWLGFAFIGTLSREAHTSFSQNVVAQVGSINPLDFTPVQQLYVVGDVLTENPSAALLIQSVFGNVPLNSAPLESVAQRFDDVNGDLENEIESPPVAMLGRYTEDIVAYRSGIVDPGHVYVMLTNNDPDDMLSDAGVEISLDIMRNAHSFQAISVLDMTTDYDYEHTLGPDYKIEKDVADLIILLANPSIWINATSSSTVPGTFALANTIIGGVDPNGNLANKLAALQLATDGLATGLRSMSYAAQLHETYVTFGASDTYVAPKTVEWTKRAPQCIPPVKNQGNCGDCWAFATEEMVSIRFCIEKITSTYAPMSVQHISSCAGENLDGCDGANPSVAAAFMSSTGVVTDECMPFTDAGKTSETKCPTNCKSGVKSAGTTYYTNVSPNLRRITGTAALKRELDLVGPFAVGFTLGSDFRSFFKSNPKGTYIMKETNSGVDHLVVLLEYHDEVNPPYWYCMNSWGPSFADNGFFRISQMSTPYANIPYQVIENNGYLITPRSVKSTVSNVIPEPNNNAPLVVIDDQIPGEDKLMDEQMKEDKNKNKNNNNQNQASTKKPKQTKKPKPTHKPKVEKTKKEKHPHNGGGSSPANPSWTGHAALLFSALFIVFLFLSYAF